MGEEKQKGGESERDRQSEYVHERHGTSDRASHGARGKTRTDCESLKDCERTRGGTGERTSKEKARARVGDSRSYARQDRRRGLAARKGGRVRIRKQGSKQAGRQAHTHTPFRAEVLGKARPLTHGVLLPLPRHPKRRSAPLPLFLLPSPPHASKHTHAHSKGDDARMHTPMHAHTHECANTHTNVKRPRMASLHMH